MALRISVVGLVVGFIPAMAFAGERPVVVELFTSQGCSSCPPANAFLNEISRERLDVLPLAFHVTYWDRLGWKDPFSLEVATMRQDYYGHRFGDGSYTPEMVVDGTVGLVGSHRDEVNAAIERAKRGQHTRSESDRESVAEGSYSSGSTTSTRRKSAAAKMEAGRSRNPTLSGQFVLSANGLASRLKSASDSRKAKTRRS